MRDTGNAHDDGRERAALYALGALSQHEARTFEEHLAEGCTTCADELGDFARVVEALAYGATPAEPPPGARAKLLARINSDGAEKTNGGDDGHSRREAGPSAGAAETKRDEARASSSPSPQDALDFLVVRSGEGRWLKTHDEGVFVKVLFVDQDRDTVTTLVRMEPGARIPRHRHRGVEQCLVLEGDVTSGPYSMTAGDFNCSFRGSVHDELTTQNGALLFLVSPEQYDVLEQHA